MLLSKNIVCSAKTLLSLFLLLSVIGAYSQEYTYDGNGNLAKDTNKEISQIHYNHLSLPDTIVYNDGRKMIYIYSAFGQKLREQSLAADGTQIQKRDYDDQFFYRNDSLREIKQEDGRAVPLLAGNNATPWEYQYRLTDHLGNVRVTVTSKQEEDNGTATLETSGAATEQSKFLRYEDARRVNSILFDHTHNGNTYYSERLSGSANEKYGLARSLSVMPGDTIKLEVYAKYVDPNSSNWQQSLITLVSQVASHATGVVLDGASYATSTSSFPSFPPGVLDKSTSTGGPNAYLNWLVFDRNFVYKDGGFKRMSTIGKENGSNVAHEKLEGEFVVREPGYVYVYLSNEEPTPLEVYFDDFTVSQVKGPVVQQADYDPFGLTFNEYTRENSVANNTLYNGKELQEDFDLNWYDYGARMYDAALGRWHVVDPMAIKYPSWSPYNYVLNSPSGSTDPDGKDAQLVIDYESGIVTVQANFYMFANDMNLGMEGADVWSDLNGKTGIQIDGKEFKLNFSLTIIPVAGVDPVDMAQNDPIGNVISLTNSGSGGERNGEKIGGATAISKDITIPIDANAVAMAHEMGHTFLGVGLEGHEHVSNTIMDTYAASDQNRSINSQVVSLISQTYGLEKNNYPTKSDIATKTLATGEERYIYYGENFRTVYQPRISNDVLRNFFNNPYNRNH